MTPNCAFQRLFIPFYVTLVVFFSLVYPTFGHEFLRAGVRLLSGWNRFQPGYKHCGSESEYSVPWQQEANDSLGCIGK
ncbi:unnamed protein product, partial [Bubo scandiacus]